MPGASATATAAAWRLATQPTAEVERHADPVIEVPGDVGVVDTGLHLPDIWPRKGFISSVHWHITEHGDEPGQPTMAWIKLLRPLVEGMVFRGVLLPGDENAMLREIIEVRTGLDLSLAPLMVERLAGDADTDELRACVEEMKDKASRNQQFPVEDRQFHLLLAQKWGNRLYGQLVAAFWDIHMAVGPSLGADPQRELDVTAAAHERMLDAAVAGDLDAYRGAVEAHYGPIRRLLTAWASA